MTVRCFAGLALPPEAREALARAVRPFQQRKWPVRWVRDEGAHVTLKFYGEVAEERVDAISESLDLSARGIGVIPLTLTGFGAFPAPEKARVLYASAEAPPSLELLQDRIETRAEALGHPGEGAVYHPHITLGRVREGERIPPAEVEMLFAWPLQVSCLLDRVTLFESRPGPGGATYVALHEAALGAA